MRGSTHLPYGDEPGRSESPAVRPFSPFLTPLAGLNRVFLGHDVPLELACFSDPKTSNFADARILAGTGRASQNL